MGLVTSLIPSQDIYMSFQGIRTDGPTASKFLQEQNISQAGPQPSTGPTRPSPSNMTLTWISIFHQHLTLKSHTLPSLPTRPCQGWSDRAKYV